MWRDRNGPPWLPGLPGYLLSRYLEGRWQCLSTDFCGHLQQGGSLQAVHDQDTDHCGRADSHDYQLFLAINDIDHTRTKAKSPQTNGICERFHKTILQESYQVTFRKKLYGGLESLQADFDEWLVKYNTQRTHQGKMCCGRTPMETLECGKQIWKEKFVA